MQAVFGDQPFLIDLLVKGGKVEGADIVLKNKKERSRLKEETLYVVIFR